MLTRGAILPLRHLLSLVALGVLLASLLPADADITGQWHEERTESGQINVTTHDRELSVDLLELTRRLQAQLQDRCHLAPAPSTSLLIRVESWDLVGDGKPPAIIGWLQNGKLTLQLTLFHRFPDRSTDLIEWLTKVSLYQDLYPEGGKVSREDQLPDLPFWLRQGVLEVLLAGRSEVDARIVARAQKIQKTAPLTTVLGWSSLSPDPVERAWQEAWCWRVWEFISRNPDRWAATRQILSSHVYKAAGLDLPWLAQDNLPQLWHDFSETRGIAPDQFFFGWDQVEEDLLANFSVTLPGDKAKSEPDRTYPVSKLAAHRQDPGFVQGVRARLASLLVLEMRAHFSWAPVIADYRRALTSLLNRDTTEKQYSTLLTEARRKRNELTTYHRKVNDYLNWFEVTQQNSGGPSAFEDYFRLNDELDGDFNRRQARMGEDLQRFEDQM